MAAFPLRRLLTFRAGLSLIDINNNWPICFVCTPLRPYLFSASPSHTRSASTKPYERPRNEQIIKANYVTGNFVDADSVFHGLVHIPQLLASIDRRKYALVLLSPGDEANPPLIKQFTLEALEAKMPQQLTPAQLREQQKLERKRNPPVITKEFQVTWAIDPHDLGIKLKRMGEMLEKGYRVQVVIAGKRGMTKVTREQAESVVMEVERIAEARQATEYKKRDGEIGKQLTVFFSVERGRRAAGVGESEKQEGLAEEEQAEGGATREVPTGEVSAEEMSGEMRIKG